MDSDMLSLIDESYNKSMFTEIEISFVDRIGFFNIGYWRGNEASVELAQLRLIETLIQHFSLRGGGFWMLLVEEGLQQNF